MRFSHRLHLAARGSRSRQPVTRYDPAAESAQPQFKASKPVNASSTSKAKHAKHAAKAPRGRKTTRGRTTPPASAATTIDTFVSGAPPHQSPSPPAASAITVGAPTADPGFGIEGGELLWSSSGHGLLGASMDYIDPATNSDKFYMIQAIGTAQGTFVCMRWGRRGTKGQQNIEGPMDTATAEAKFESKFKAKTGLNFADRDAEALSGKYKMAKRLREAGAGEGEVAVSLMWDNTPAAKNDLDLHVTAPSGEEIYYCHKQSGCGGVLDVDRMQNAPEPVENIVWTCAPRGQYTVHVNNFSASHNSPTPFKVAVTLDGVRQMFDGVVGPPSSEKRKVLVTQFTR